MDDDGKHDGDDVTDEGTSSKVKITARERRSRTRNEATARQNVTVVDRCRRSDDLRRQCHYHHMQEVLGL